MSNYKVSGKDIEDLLEIFHTSENITLTHSSFNSSNIKKNSEQLETYLNGYIPTSAGENYLGGKNVVNYKVNGINIDCALKGCRPSGQLLLATINGVVGTTNVIKYLNRINNETWLSDTKNSATGIQLAHNPKFVHIFLTGGGGSGATIPSTSWERRSGGSAGASIYYPAEIPENGYLEISVGFGGQALAVKSEPPGVAGGNSTLTSSTAGLLATAGGGFGGGDTAHIADSDHNHAVLGGTATFIVTTFLKGNAISINGGYSGGSENNHGNREAIDSQNIKLCIPEDLSKAVGGFPATSAVNNAGGFGGNSIWAQGGLCGTRTAGDSGTLGSGGASTGRYSNVAGNGGPGVCYIYY